MLAIAFFSGKDWWLSLLLLGECPQTLLSNITAASTVTLTTDPKIVQIPSLHVIVLLNDRLQQIRLSQYVSFST